MIQLFVEILHENLLRGIPNHLYPSCCLIQLGRPCPLTNVEALRLILALRVGVLLRVRLDAIVGLDSV
jgi:hypothetical protein